MYASLLYHSELAILVAHRRSASSFCSAAPLRNEHAWTTGLPEVVGDLEHAVILDESATSFIFCPVVGQGCLYDLTHAMAHWYPFAQPYFQPQPHPQLGLVPDATYGCMPHPACLVPAPTAYAYGSHPMGMQPVPHFWVPFKLVPETGHYPYLAGQLQAQQAVEHERQPPYREGQRLHFPPRHASCQMTGSEASMHATWPDSPMTAQLQGRSASWATEPAAHDCCAHTCSSPSPPQTPGPKHPNQDALGTQLAQLRVSQRAVPASGRSDQSATNCAPSCSSSGLLAPDHLQAASRHKSQPKHVLGSGDSSTAQPGAAAKGFDAEAGASSSAWQWLTEALLKEVMGQLPQHCRKRCRLVCKRWRSIMDLHIQV